MKSINHNPEKHLIARMALLSAFVPLLCAQAIATEESGPHGLTRKNDTKEQKEVLLSTINNITEELIGKNRKKTNVADKALLVRQAILKKDYSAADTIVKDVYKETTNTGWHFQPYTRLIMSVEKNINNEYESHLNEWISIDTNNATPLILRAQYYYSAGWTLRGKRSISYVGSKKARTFQSLLDMSKNDVLTALRIDEHNPFSWHLLLADLLGSGDDAEMEAAFQKAIKVFPDYYQLYSYRFKKFLPKWGGSVEAMYSFVNRYAGEAPENSNLKMLYLDLYSNLTEIASRSCYRKYNEELTDCISTVMQLLVTDKLSNHVFDSIKMSEKSGVWGFSIELGYVLRRMINQRGMRQYTWMLLELASENMRRVSDENPNEDIETNFMIERVTGLLWINQNNQDHAVLAFARAIESLNRISAPDAESKDYELAMIYDSMAKALYNSQQYPRAIAYQRAAEYLAGKTRNNDDRYLQCQHLFELNLNEEAIRVCTSEIEDNGNLNAALWRGNAYDRLGDFDNAKSDMTLLADSAEFYRAYAALYLVSATGRDDDVNKMMEILNRYTYLFDDNVTSREHVSTAYANRCYGNKRLGNYEKALKDCTTSLKYAPSKYAFRLQRDLVKILKKE